MVALCNAALAILAVGFLGEMFGGATSVTIFTFLVFAFCVTTVLKVWTRGCGPELPVPNTCRLMDGLLRLTSRTMAPEVVLGTR